MSARLFLRLASTVRGLEMNQVEHGIRRLKPKLMAAALCVTWIGMLTTSVGAQNASYSDLAQNHWAYDAVAELSNLGILTGYPDGRFDGTRAATRYELAVVAARVLEIAGSGESSIRLAERVAALEQALRQIASRNYANRLEDRIVALEVALNTQPLAEAPPKQKGEREQADLSTRKQGNRRLPNRARASMGIQLSERPAHPFYVGISPGVVSTAGDVYLSFQAGYDSLLGPVGPALRLTFNSGNRELRFAFDALGRAALPIEELKLYAGLGLGATVRPEGGSFLLEAPFGGEYLITERVGLFVQLITSYGFAPVNDVDAEVSAGINLRF